MSKDKQLNKFHKMFLGESKYIPECVTDFLRNNLLLETPDGIMFHHYYESGLTEIYAPGLRKQFSPGSNMNEESVLSRSPVSIEGEPIYTDTCIKLKLKSKEGWNHLASDEKDKLPILEVEFPLGWRLAIGEYDPRARFLYNH